MNKALPLFAFGTLRDRDVLELVLARSVSDDTIHPATLTGFRIVRLPDENYPVLVHAPGEPVKGAVIADLHAEDMKRIVFFEGEEYALRECKVAVEGKGMLDAVFWGEGTVVPGSVEPWDLEQWRRTYKAGFIDKIRRYMALCGQVDIDEAERLWAKMDNGP